MAVEANVESRHAITDLKNPDYVFVYENAIDRIRAFCPAMRVLFGNISEAHIRTKEVGGQYEAALAEFKAERLDVRAFNMIADEYYYEHYYAPEIFASALVHSSVDILFWVAKNLLRFEPGDRQFGLEVNLDDDTLGSVGFGNLLRALRHHAAHFEEWLDMSTPSKNALKSWNVLSRFGYTLPLGNTSVLFDAVKRVSRNDFETYVGRLGGAALDLCVEAERAGIACLSPIQLRERHQL